MMAIFKERRDLIVSGLNEVKGVTCISPCGALYAWPKITKLCKIVSASDSEKFRKKLLHDAGVAVLADIHFGMRVPGEGQQIRFSNATSDENIIKGIERITNFVRTHRR